MARILALILILGLSVGGYLIYQHKRQSIPKPQEAIEVAPQRWQVSSTTTENSSQLSMQANATLALLEDNATTANATSEKNATLSIPSDKLVTHEFVHDLASFLVANYFPANTQRNPGEKGRFNLNIKSANIRYGVDFPGLDVDLVDILGSRQAIFEHVLNNTVLDFLAQAYTPLLLDSLNQALATATWTNASGEEIQINESQRKEMLVLLANKVRVIGQTVTALATSETISSLVNKYLEDMDQVNQAHMHFWELQGSPNASPAALNDASAQIKSSIQTREMSRQRLLQTIATSVNPQGMDASELVYLAQWIHRRGEENPDRLALVAKAGNLLTQTAATLEKHASQVQ